MHGARRALSHARTACVGAIRTSVHTKGRSRPDGCGCAGGAWHRRTKLLAAQTQAAPWQDASTAGHDADGAARIKECNNSQVGGAVRSTVVVLKPKPSPATSINTPDQAHVHHTHAGIEQRLPGETAACMQHSGWLPACMPQPPNSCMHHHTHSSSARCMCKARQPSVRSAGSTAAAWQRHLSPKHAVCCWQHTNCTAHQLQGLTNSGPQAVSHSLAAPSALHSSMGVAAHSSDTTP